MYVLMFINKSKTPAYVDYKESTSMGPLQDFLYNSNLKDNEWLIAAFGPVQVPDSKSEELPEGWHNKPKNVTFIEGKGK